MLSLLAWNNIIQKWQSWNSTWPQSSLHFFCSVPGSLVLEVLEVLRLLGMGFIKRHLVGCRFLMLVRVQSSQKLVLLELYLPVEMGEDQHRAAAFLVASSEAFRASGLKVRIFYNWWHSFDGVSPSEHLAFKSSMEKDTVYSTLPRTVFTTQQAKRGKQWRRVGWGASQRWWSAQSSLITFFTFFRELKVLYPPFPSFPFLSLSLSLLSTVPYLSLPFPAHPSFCCVPLFFLFSSLCCSVIFLLCFCDFCLFSLPPVAIAKMRKNA